ncbi:MAG: hypothetical protein NTY64_15745 [Deltaproteobacteria bacterium]|nr:hypothetical protein [Deltaproteobacteria bacterium]
MEASLDLIDSYPLQTSRGVWGRDQMRDMMVHGKMESAGEAKPVGQGFHILDDDHAVCMEKWGTQEEAVTLNHWTFLVKRDSQWKIQEIRYGQEDPLSRGNAGPKRVEIEGG